MIMLTKMCINVSMKNMLMKLLNLKNELKLNLMKCLKIINIIKTKEN